jgi:hypothetical protein
MKKKIIANGKEHLFLLLDLEISASGSDCDLNHIDVSQVTSMEGLFQHLRFNGDISKWDTSKVETMENIFFNTSFNGDISQWDVSNVKNMERAFYQSKFNGDISQWNVSKVVNMQEMFSYSKFNGDISNWDVSRVKKWNIYFLIQFLTVIFKIGSHTRQTIWKRCLTMLVLLLHTGVFMRIKKREIRQ